MKLITPTELSNQTTNDKPGNGPSFVDGTFDEAAFNRCQGVAFDALHQKLYICDTENHALRCADLVARRVTTICGDGVKGDDFSGGGVGQFQRINSPWDVVHLGSSSGRADDEGRLLIAMAGTHQIWEHDLRSKVTKV